MVKFHLKWPFKKVLILLVLALSVSVQTADYKIVCYFTNWAVQRPGLGSFVPEHVDPCLCTHIIYSFSEMKDNKLYPMEKYDHKDPTGDNPGFFERFNNLKLKNPSLKTLIAVGGWDMGMGAFSTMAKNEKSMKKFVTSTVDYLKKWKFDGLDLDFEYPGIDWRGSAPEDKMAFTKLCKMLREAFEQYAKDTGKERFLLTAAVAGAKNTIDKAYEVDKVSEYLDWFNLMTYDLHGPWDTNAGHHSAIKGRDSQDYLNIDFIINYYESKGAPREKLMLGLANYGRSDSPAMPYTGFKGESGFISYYESCLMLSCENWKEFWNEPQAVPYAKGKDNFPWAGYDNVKSMKIKAEYIIKKKLAGAMFWTLDLDDFTSKFCCQGFFPLIRTVKSVLQNEPKWMPPTKVCSSCPTTEYKTLKKKNKRRKRAVAAPPEEVCAKNGEGVWEDPTDCTQYYVCRSITTTWGEKKLEKCYAGSYFDKVGKQCKWVGEGNYNCDTILGKSSEDGDGEAKDSGLNDKEDKDSEQTAVPVAENDNLSSNKQKIFYEIQASKLQADTFITSDLYTCTSNKGENNEMDSDYIKCYSCEDTNAKQCQSSNSTVIPCYLKAQKCYTKALYNANNQLISFSKGCASKIDLESFLSEIGDDKGDQEEKEKKRKNNRQTNCIKRSNSKRVCYDLCETNLCNAKHDFTSVASRVAETNAFFTWMISSLFFLYF